MNGITMPRIAIERDKDNGDITCKVWPLVLHPSGVEFTAILRLVDTGMERYWEGAGIEQIPKHVWDVIWSMMNEMEETS